MHDCIVIGGGVIGMLTARELAHSGVRVKLFDRGALGQECSWAGGGILSPLCPWRVTAGLSELARWSQAYFPELIETLQAETGIDPEWQRCGMLVLTPDDLDNAISWSKAQGIPVELLASDALFRLEPALKQGQYNALCLPDIAQIRNPRLIDAIKQSLRQLGVELFEHTGVQGISAAGQKLCAIETAAGTFACDFAVIACGAWSSQLTRDFGSQLSVTPVRGQMICYRATPGYLQHILIKDDSYVIPRKDGHLLVGSTLEDAGFDKGTTTEARQQLESVAASFLPDIKHFPFVRHWSGLRPKTPTGIPYIGPYPGVEGLFLNTGHYRNGVLLAPGSARLLADIMLNRQTIVVADNFQFHREEQLVTH
ncbi:MAG: glycine oxidase ThiO [Gammaproteobacteria bacterium]